MREWTKTSYAEVLATARQKVSLAEVGIERVKIRKAITGSIFREVPRDKERGKTPALATAQALDLATVRVVAPTRTSELEVTGIDISVGNEEFRKTLAGARGFRALEVRV